MNQDFLSLDETARRLNKSTQTIRRMIKKGELKAQRIKTPQGFHYVVNKAELEPMLEAPQEPIVETMFSNSPIQNVDLPQQEAKIPVLTNQTEILTNQNPIEPIPEPVKVPLDTTENKTVFYFPPLPPTPPSSGVETKDLLRLIERQHREQLGLIKILETMQRELFWERQQALTRPKTLWQHIADWLNGN